MPISTQCPGCQGLFHLPDHLAGQNVRCQQCQTVFTATEIDPLSDLLLNPDEFIDHTGSSSGLQSETADEQIGKKYDTTYVKSASSRGTGTDDRTMVVGMIVGLAILFLAALAIGLWFLLAPAAKVVADVAMDTVAETVEDDSDEEQNATDGKPDAKSLDELNNQFNNNTVTVNFTNVQGDTFRAKRYLRYKIHDAAYFDYRLAAAEADAQTAANRQQAEQEAINRAAPYQHFVRYEYRRVQSPLPYPSIIDQGRIGTTISYVCGPCKNPTVFSQNIGMPNSTVNGRVITVKCNFQGEIPHPEVEKLTNEHGSQSVAKVVVSNAKGPEDLVILYLREKTPRQVNEFSPRLTVAGIENINDNTYQYYAGRVDDVNEFANMLGSSDWAQVKKVDAAKRTVYLTANLPAELPSAEDFRALRDLRREIERKERDIRSEQDRLARNQAREKEQLARDQAREASRLNDEADKKGKARPGESDADWIERSFADKSPFYFDEFLVNLAKTNVNPEILDSVSSNLVSALEETNSTSHAEELINAMLAWRTEETEAAIFEMVDDRRYSSQVVALMNAMRTIGTAEAAEKLATGLTHQTESNRAKKHLIALGEIAEPAVTPMMRHPIIEVRYQAYEVLYNVGTRASLPRLKENRKMEKMVEMKKNIKSVIDAIEERYPEEEEE